MKKRIMIIGVLVFIFLCLGATGWFMLAPGNDGVVYAQAASPSGQPVVDQKANNRANYLIASAIAAALAITFAAGGCGVGQGIAVGKALEAIGRNPETLNKMFPVLILGLAFIESLTLYALLISLSLMFFNPLLSKL